MIAAIGFGMAVPTAVAVCAGSLPPLHLPVNLQILLVNTPTQYSIADGTVSDGLGPVCVDLEAPNPPARPAAATAIVECWDWSADASQDTCNDKNGVSQFGDWGVYYCPPRGAHAACDQNGSPTTGTIDLAINKQPSETVAFWCAEFSGGRFSDECTAERNDTDCDRLKAGTLEGGSISGTFGGYADFAALP